MKKLYYKFVKKYWSIISYEHAKKHKFVVQNGIFKNLKLNHEISLGKGDIASKVYGFYENKIQEKLKDIKKPILIDIGAADGFFAVGSLKSKICDFCYDFEETKKSRENLYKTAEINDVKNNLSIMGAVTKDNFFSLLLSEIDFLKRVKKYFDVSIIIDNDKSFENLLELHSLNEIDRNLITCEGRSYIGKWWHLSPK